MHAFIHTYIHTYIRTCIHTFIHTYIHAFLHTYIHTYIHTCIHTYIQTYIHTYIHTYVRTYVHTYICYIRKYVHTHIRTYGEHGCVRIWMDFFWKCELVCLVFPIFSVSRNLAEDRMVCLTACQQIKNRSHKVISTYSYLFNLNSTFILASEISS